MSDEKPEIDPDMIAAIKAQVIEEMKTEETRLAEEAKIRREAQRQEHEAYIKTMKESPDPWVEIQGWVETKEGVRVELEWNDAFVEHLKENGITGTDEDAAVQKWIAILMHDMATQIEETDEGEFEG